MKILPVIGVLLLACMGCKDDSEAGKRLLEYDLDELGSLAKEGSSEEIRTRAARGMSLLQDGVEDEAPFVVIAQVAYEDVKAVREGGKGPALIVKFISEVFAEGTLELSDGKGGWISKVLGVERRRMIHERRMRAVIVPIKLIALPPGDDAGKVEGREVRIVIRGKASNHVKLERVVVPDGR